MSERDSFESTDEEYTYRVTLHSVHDEAQPLTEMTIGGKTVKCLIDSGAGVNVIDTRTFNQLGNITFHLPQRGSTARNLPSAFQSLECLKSTSQLRPVLCSGWYRWESNWLHDGS